MRSIIRSIFNQTKQDAAFTIGSPAIIWQILFFYFPLGLMLLHSICIFSEAGAIKELTIRQFTPILTPIYFSIIGNSLLLSLGTSICALLIAYPLAYTLSIHTTRYKELLVFLLFIPFWTNFLLHIYAWFFILEKYGVLNTLLQYLGFIKSPIHFLNSIYATLLMMTYYYLPFMLLPIFSSLDKIDHQLFDASLNLGASRFLTFKKILLPLTLPGIQTGFLLVFISSFGEFIIPELMGGDRQYFVGNVISQYILTIETKGIGAAFIIISAAALMIAIVLIYRIFKIINYILLKKSYE